MPLEGGGLGAAGGRQATEAGGEAGQHNRYEYRFRLVTVLGASSRLGWFKACPNLTMGGGGIPPERVGPPPPPHKDLSPPPPPASQTKLLRPLILADFCHKMSRPWNIVVVI